MALCSGLSDMTGLKHIGSTNPWLTTVLCGHQGSCNLVAATALKTRLHRKECGAHNLSRLCQPQHHTRLRLLLVLSHSKANDNGAGPGVSIRQTHKADVRAGCLDRTRLCSVWASGLCTRCGVLSASQVPCTWHFCTARRLKKASLTWRTRGWPCLASHSRSTN